MPTRKHVHEEVLPASPEEVFALLYTPSAIRHWWSAARAVVLPERGGVRAAAWAERELPCAKRAAQAKTAKSAAALVAHEPFRYLGEVGYWDILGPGSPGAESDPSGIAACLRRSLGRGAGGGR